MPNVKMPDGTVVAFPDDMPADKIKSLILTKFPDAGTSTAGPRMPPFKSLINFPTAAGNTPSSAAVMQMQGGGSAGTPVQPPGPPVPQATAAQGQVAAPASPSPAPQSTGAGPQTAPPQSGSGNWLIDAAKTMAGSLASFGSSMENATPVIGPAMASASSGIEAGINHLTGAGPQDMGGVAQQQQQLRQDYPLPSLAGQVAGVVAPAMIPGVGEALGGSSLESGVANVGKAMFAGGATGAADTYARTGDPEAAAVGGVTSALAGPIIGKAAGAVAGGVKSILTGSEKRAWAYIASKMGVSADDLQNYVASHQQLTGRKPSVQQVLDAHAAGAVKDFAKSNPQTAMGLQQAQETESAALPAQAAKVVQDTGIQSPTPKFLQGVPTNAQSPEALLNARDAGADQAFGAVRDTPIDLPQELRTNRLLYSEAPSISVDPQSGQVSQGTRFKIQAIQNAHDAGLVARQTAADPKATAAAKAAANKAARAAVKLANKAGPVTVGEADVIRKGLNRTANGTGENAGEARNTAEALGNYTRATVPEYGEALDNYAAADRYRQGFEHSYASGAPAHTATDPNLRDALASPEGQQGHAAGVTTFYRNQAATSPAGALRTMQDLGTPGTAQAAVAAAGTRPISTAPAQARALVSAQRSITRSTPQTLQPQDDSHATSGALIGAAETAAGLSFAGVRQMARAASDFMRRNTFSPKVQQTIARGLTSHDPAIVKSTIDNLQSARASVKGIKDLQTAFAASSSSIPGQYIAETRDDPRASAQ